MMGESRNNSLCLLTLFLCSLLLICSLCCESNTQRELNVETIAKEVCQGVGIVREISAGKGNTPIVILEESHNSRAGQIEHAITLVRLYERHGLRHIALEGYLEEREEVKTDWFTSATQKSTFEHRASIVVQLLKEGEISCAEFMKLVYDDISLHPIETIAEYTVDLGVEGSLAPIHYLVRIAEPSFSQEHRARLKQLMEDFKQLESEGNQEEIERKRDEIYDYMFSVDPWVQDKAKLLRSDEMISAEGELELAKEIVNYAEKLSIKFEPEEKEAMEQYLEFFRIRGKASKTMVDSAMEIVRQPGISTVAMVIGAAHTETICTSLKKAKHPFAVIRPQSFDGDTPLELFERKYKRLSIYSEGFLTETLLKEFSTLRKKPEPVISEPWFQGKVELYTFTDQIVRGVLGPPSPPDGGKPPFGFSDDDFRGRWVSIDPEQISIIPDREGSDARAVLFPAMLKGTEIWIKAGMSDLTASSRQRKTVEAMLEKALEDVKNSEEIDKKIEDESGVVNINTEVLAGIAGNKASARSIVLKI